MPGLTEKITDLISISEQAERVLRDPKNLRKGSWRHETKSEAWAHLKAEMKELDDAIWRKEGDTDEWGVPYPPLGDPLLELGDLMNRAAQLYSILAREREEDI